MYETHSESYLVHKTKIKNKKPRKLLYSRDRVSQARLEPGILEAQKKPYDKGDSDEDDDGQWDHTEAEKCLHRPTPCL